MPAVTATAFGIILTGLLPVYAIAALGHVLRQRAVLSEPFMADSAKLIFNFAAPATLFLALAGTTPDTNAAPEFFVTSLALLIGLTLLACVLTPVVVPERHHRGVFIQGATRGNLLVAGLVFAHAIFGLEGLALASVPLGLYVVFNNIFSVWILKRYQDNHTDISPWQAWRDTLASPIVIAVFAGYLCSALELSLPTALVETGDLLAKLTVPLILINVGGSFDLKQLRRPGAITWTAAIYKCLCMPVAGVAVAYILGFRNIELAVIFLLLSAPTSMISVVFTRMFGGDSALAANIVLISSLLSFVTIAAGLVTLQSLGWIL